MRLTQKLGKITTGAAWESAGRHLRRMIRGRRVSTDLTAEGIMRTIDQGKFAEIRARYEVANAGGDPPKYLNWRTWLAANVRRIRDLELDLGKRRRVLDIGCGNGYFLYICKLLGHEVQGLDIGDYPMFSEVTRLLEVPRVNWRIKPFEPLPDLGARFDIVSAHMICFNNHKHANLWGPAEWDFFLTDLGSHLAPRGRVWLELNREYDGTCYTPELKASFEKRGAVVVANRVTFNSGIRALAGAAPAAR